MKVSVGSRNPVKIRAVEECFKLFYKDVVVEAKTVESIPQPIGYAETLRYAVLRGLQAISQGEHDYGVGIEAGLIEVPWSITGYMDKHICAIVDKNHLVTIGVSMGFELPQRVIEEILSGKHIEVEEVIEEISGIQGIGDNIGAVGYLTSQKIKRIDLCMQAVISALTPRLNKKYYNVKWPTAEEIVNAKIK